MIPEMPHAGDMAPDFTAMCTDGEFTLSERVKDGPVLLYFYVVNYGRTCTDYLATMNERFEDFRSRGITLYQVNHDSIENHRDWMRHTASKYEIVSDPGEGISRSYGCIVVRAKSDKILGNPNRGFFLIGKDMRVLYAWQAYWPTETVPMDELFERMDEAVGRDVNGVN